MTYNSRVLGLGVAIIFLAFSHSGSIRGQGLAGLLEDHEAVTTARPVATAPADGNGQPGATVTGGSEASTITNDQKRAAAERVRQVFAQEVANAKTPTQKVSVAKAMIALVPEASDPAEAYVLLEAGVSLAIEAQDPTVMDEGIGLLSKMFGVDLKIQRRDALIAMGKKAPLDRLATVVDALITESGVAANAGRFEVAKEAAKAAATAARRLRDPARQKMTANSLQRLSEQEKAQAAIQPLLDRLAANPKDSTALLELGKYRCFEEGNWKAGLELLAGCAEPALAQAARSDLTVDGSPAGHVKVADLWFALHEKESGNGPTGPTERAKFHYERALGEATGLARAHILKRLDEIGKLEGGADNWIVLFRSNDPAIWNTTTDEGFLRFALPLESVPPSVRYARIRRPNGEAVVLTISKNHLSADVFGDRYGWCGSGKKLMKDTFLGVCDFSEKLSPNDVGKVFVGQKDGVIFSGWGFGHKIKSGTQTSMAWNGQTVPREPLEISVLARELTPKERRQVILLQ